MTNGFSEKSTPNVLFHNQADGTFADATVAIGGGAFDGRGVAFADYDRDGDVDLLVTADAGQPTRLWRNDTVTQNHWLTLQLIGTRSNRSAIGARVEITTPLMTTVQEASGGAGRGSFNSLPVEFGLGADTSITQAAIRWPNGDWQTLHDLDVDQFLVVTEPEWGDLNCDGLVDFDDVDPFVMALSGPEGYLAQFPDCNWYNADVDSNGFVNFDDIDPFVVLLGLSSRP